jgi:beta-phosphoglucomutase-like phosphatase (HAD superfamily)
MLPLNDYGVLILDCDGVIFNSNSLKIKAMEMALLKQGIGDSQLQNCLYYFKNNFGKSRFHHIEYFVDKFIKLNGIQKQLNAYCTTTPKNANHFILKLK